MSLLFISLLNLAEAVEVTLQNDTSNNSFGFGDMVAWLEYPECVVSVLTPDPTDYPIELHTVEVFFASQYGTLDNIQSSILMGVQNLISRCCYLAPYL